MGRSHELDVLRGTWERVADERTPHLVTVIGPAGVGKTRLASEFSAMVRDRGGRTVRGRVLPYRESTAYSALAFQLKQLSGIFETDSAEVARTKLAEVVGSLLPEAEVEQVTGHLAILIGVDPVGTVSDRESLFFSVRDFIEAMAAEQPTMLVFEDIHWADEALLELAGKLSARLRDVPVLVLALTRPELLELRPGWGAGLAAHTALTLRPLGAQEATDLAAHRLAEAGASESAAAGGGPRSGGRRQPSLHRAARGGARGVRGSQRPAADHDPRNHRRPPRRASARRSGRCSSTLRSPAESSGRARSSACPRMGLS